MENSDSARAVIIGAPASGSGKTVITLGLAAAMVDRGLKVAPAKTGPDYIDTTFLSEAAGFGAINLDPWAMDKGQLKACSYIHSRNADLLLIEGVMGLFDGAANGTGSTADLAAILQFPIVLVVDAGRQSQSVAALVSGFVNWRPDVRVAGIILNNVGSSRHEKLLRQALDPVKIPVLGTIPRDGGLKQPRRHLGLLLPDETKNFDAFVQRSAKVVGNHCDLEKICSLAAPVGNVASPMALVPLGQHIAIAKDMAFAFLYRHWLDEWRDMGAQISFFSPLADDPVPQNADAVFLPGGYPELHGEKLSHCAKFFSSLNAARDRGALIYGECGGFMVLGESLRDAKGNTYKMSGLLPHATSIDRPKRVLGYRNLSHASPLPWPRHLKGHEFHYSSSSAHGFPPLFEVSDALGNARPAMGAANGKVLGSYAHIIDMDAGEGS